MVRWRDRECWYQIVCDGGYSYPVSNGMVYIKTPPIVHEVDTVNSRDIANGVVVIGDILCSEIQVVEENESMVHFSFQHLEYVHFPIVVLYDLEWLTANVDIVICFGVGDGQELALERLVFGV